MSWREVPHDEQLAWTQVFLDYPPKFLGVTGMLGTNEGVQRYRPTEFTAWTEEALALRDLGLTPDSYLVVMTGLHSAHHDSPFTRTQIARLFDVDHEDKDASSDSGLPRRLNLRTAGLVARAIECRMRYSVILHLIVDEGVAALRRRVKEGERARQEWNDDNALMLNFVFMPEYVRNLKRAQGRTPQQDNLDV